VNFTLPDSALTKISPAPKVDTPALLSGRDRGGLHSENHPYSWKLDESVPAQISYQIGYEPAKLQRSAILLLVILLSPAAIVLWLGRKALSADVQDRAVVWFSYMRTLSWLLNGLLFVWWAAVQQLQLLEILRFLFEGTVAHPLLAHPVATQIIGWVPPTLTWVLCFRMSQPVQEKLRGLTWTKRELMLQAVYSILASLIPFAMFFTGLSLLFSSGSSAAGWFMGAFFVRVFAQQALGKVTGMQRYALTTGPLRDRAFAMAQQLGVQLREVYLISSGKGQMANAFASGGHHIAFTDVLLNRMSQREVEYVMAHELTHLRLRHPAKLGMARLMGFILGMLALTLITFLVPSADFTFARYLILFAILTTFPYLISRRFEYQADAGAVDATGDPRPAISALFKLAELNMHPLQWSKWSEKWLSHPSTLRRAQAIAAKAGIPSEEIPSIVRGSAQESCHYAPPASSQVPSKLFSTPHKKAALKQLSFAFLAILSGVPCLFVLAATHLTTVRTIQIALFSLAIPAGIGAVLTLFNYSPHFTRGSIAEVLKQRLSERNVQVDAWEGIYVGFAPSAAPRTYDSNSYWDVGYLFFRSDRICYCGEELQFALRREQITAIQLDNRSTSFLRNKRLYIAWWDQEKGTCGVFNIARANMPSILAASARTEELAGRIERWWKNPSPARPVPAPLDSLSTPPVLNVTCAIPGSVMKGRKLYNELIINGWIAALFAMLCGLKFHLLAYLAASSYSRHDIPLVYSPGAGYFVVAASTVLRFLFVIPLLLYRDKPVLTAQAPNSLSGAPPLGRPGLAESKSNLTPVS
jgi:Zn-dependent protease with chaperone function